MIAEFPVGSYVRYREDGPRGALCGLCGVVVPPSEEGKANGWVRSDIHISFDDYSVDEIELAHFWVMKAYSNQLTLGPFSTWEEASGALRDHILETVEYGENHPLNAKRNRLLSQISDCEPSPRGLRFVSQIGSFVIQPAGINPPKQYDEKGRAYA
jgi:hypothetical protein